jgi:hypothetical protein
MSSTRKVGNANVSGGALSAAERRDISTLFVKFEKRSHGNADSQIDSVDIVNLSNRF